MESVKLPWLQITQYVVKTGHNIKWDYFQVLANGSSDLHCKIKETLLIRDLKPALNENGQFSLLSIYLTIFILFSLVTSLLNFMYITFEFVQPSLLKMYVVAYETLSQK